MIEPSKNVETVERERERAIFSKIGFICSAKKLVNKNKVKIDFQNSNCLIKTLRESLSFL